MAVLAGTDFFTVEVLTLRGLVTYYELFFIHLESRRVEVAGITPHPNEGGFHNSGLRISFRNKRICHIFQHIPSPCFPIAAQHEYSLCVFFAPKYTRSFEA